jgi:heat shock protein 5
VPSLKIHADEGRRSLIGRNFSDPQLHDDVKNLPYNVIDRDGLPFIEIHTNGTLMLFSPEDITAMVLSNLKTMAECYLNRTIKHAVTTVPSYFDLAQRQAAVHAAAAAGLEVLHQYDEATAAGVAFEVDNPWPGKGSERCEMCHFVFFHATEEGSGLDLVSCDGDLGVFNQLAIVRDRGLDPNSLERASPAKSPNGIGSILEQFYQYIAENPLAPSSDSVEALVEKLLEKGGLEKKDVNWLILAGISEHVAKFKPLIEKYFNGKSVLSKSLWEAKVILADEAIVRGAAIQGERFSYDGGYRPLLMDTNPLSLGVETVGDVFTTMIRRETAIPKTYSRKFSTIQDNQTTVVLKILEGERALASKNRQLTALELTGLLPRPRNVPEILVTFVLHCNETLQVMAEDKESGKRAMVFVEEKAIDRYTWEELKEIFREGDSQIQKNLMQQKQRAGGAWSAEEVDFGVIAVDMI